MLNNLGQKNKVKAAIKYSNLILECYWRQVQKLIILIRLTGKTIFNQENFELFKSHDFFCSKIVTLEVAVECRRHVKLPFIK